MESNPYDDTGGFYMGLTMIILLIAVGVISALLDVHVL
jgi:hypothetical protein